VVGWGGGGGGGGGKSELGGCSCPPVFLGWPAPTYKQNMYRQKLLSKYEGYNQFIQC